MKLTKKLFSIILAVVMLAVMAMPTFAAGEGTITINNAVAGNDYSVYKILNLESYNADTNKYAYKASEKWDSFVEDTNIQNIYLVTDDNGYVTWKEGADVVDFTELAIDYAESHKIAPEKTITAANTTVSFTEMDLGYYLLDTSLGALCSIDTTNPTVEMEEKNEKPEIDKKVKQLVYNAYESANTASIGDTVYFKTTVTAQKGAHNYIVHDAMSEGLTFNEDSVKISVGGAPLDTKFYEIKTNFTNTDDHPHEIPCTFHVEFVEEYLDTITGHVEIVIEYSAVLNENAAIAEDPNYNNTKLEYGDNMSTEWIGTVTYSFHIDVVKTDKDKNILTGAEFNLYEEDGEEPIKFVKVGNIDGITVYRKAMNDEENTTDVIEAGFVSLEGFGWGNYYLREIKAPDGYNKLDEDIKIEVTTSNLHARIDDYGKYSLGGVQVVNQSGTELPSTGGIGTTLFYIAGGAMFIGALVMLVTKKRMKD